MMMDRVILRASSLRRALCHSSSSSLFSSKTLLLTSPRRRLGELIVRKQPPLPYAEIQKPFSSFNSPLLHQTRTYISEMRKSEFEEEEEEEEEEEGNILRILRNEIIQYQSEYAPPSEHVTKYGPFTVETRPGEEWIRLTSKYGEKESITIIATKFDVYFSAAAPPRAGDDNNNNKVQQQLLHMSLIVYISKRGNDSVLKFVCSESLNSFEIHRVFMLNATPYMGPDFKELCGVLQGTLYELLEDRGVFNHIKFLREYRMNKDKIECIRWMGKVKSFIEK